MPLADNYIISDEERTMWMKRCQFLYRVYQKQRYTKENVTTIFNEWSGIANRLRKGGEMIEHHQKQHGSDISNIPHMVPLIHLYYFLIVVFNIYDGFMQSMFANEPHLYTRAYERVRDILLE